MALLLFGLIVFLGSHLLPAFPAARGALVARLGATGYKVAFALVALAGLVMIFMGKGAAPFVPVWTPPTFLRHLTLLLMLPAFVLLAATYAPCNIRRIVGHPMVLAVKTWALAHLLANGDAASMLLFGSFLAWGVFDLVSVKKRSADAPARPSASWAADAVVVVVGVAAYLAVMRYHYQLFGVPVVG